MGEACKVSREFAPRAQRETPQPSAEIGSIRWFRYVPHARIAEFEAKGWRFAADLGPTHGRWSVMMEYCGEDAGAPP